MKSVSNHTRLPILAAALFSTALLTPGASYGLGGLAIQVATSTSPRSTPSAAPVSRESEAPKENAKPAATASAKSPKGVVGPVAQLPEAGPEFTFTAGWDSRYMFKSLDNIDSSSVGDVENSIWYTRLAATYKGFGFSLGYLQAAEKTNPSRDLSNDKAFYSEIILGANYTFSLVDQVLEATVGYNAYFFPEEGFWGGSYQGEAYARLSYVQIDHFTPSVTYSYFHSDASSLDNSYWIDFRLDGDFDLFTVGSVKVGLNPYAAVGFDGHYNANGNDWSAVEVGVRIPITLSDNLVLALSANYGWDLGQEDNNGIRRSSFGTSGSEVGFWGGASLTYKF